MLFLNFAQFCLIHHIPDPGLDHGLYGPSGHISASALKSLKTRRDEQYTALHAGEEAYQYLIDCGAIVDPSGKWTPNIIDHRAVATQAAGYKIQQAERLECLANGGMRPRVHRKLATELRQQAADLLAPYQVTP